MTTNDVSRGMIAEFGRKYLWWKPVGEDPHSEDRIIAQTMNRGTYDDILLLEQTVGKSRLVEIMLHAEPGWINDRFWEFWRGRLSFDGSGDPGQGSAEVVSERVQRRLVQISPAVSSIDAPSDVAACGG
jgi:hypothetical protein